MYSKYRIDRQFLLTYFFFFFLNKIWEKINFVNFKLNLSWNMIFSLCLKNYFVQTNLSQIKQNYGFILVESEIFDITEILYIKTRRSLIDAFHKGNTPEKLCHCELVKSEIYHRDLGVQSFSDRKVDPVPRVWININKVDKRLRGLQS